jgi:hypothetical protein
MCPAPREAEHTGNANVRLTYPWHERDPSCLIASLLVPQVYSLFKPFKPGQHIVSISSDLSRLDIPAFL